MGGAVRARETWTAPVSGHAGIAPHRHDGTGAGKRAAAQRTGTGAAGAGRVTGDAPAFMGGQWQTIRRHCVFPIVRLIRCSRVSCRTRGTASRRASFSGLTRFDRDSQYPCGIWRITGRFPPTVYAGIFIFAPRCTGIMAMRWTPRSYTNARKGCLPYRR